MTKFAATGARSANRVSMARLQAALEGVSEAGLKRADKRALASVIRRFEPLSKRIIREKYNVKASQLSGKFQVRSGSAAEGDYVELFASTRKIPLINFGGRWGGRKTAGATARILLGQQKTYKSAFIATVGGQRRLVARQFSRDATTPSGRDPRSKLRTLMGPSPLQMVVGIGEENAKAISEKVNEFRLTEILRQLRLARGAKR